MKAYTIPLYKRLRFWVIIGVSICAVIGIREEIIKANLPIHEKLLLVKRNQEIRDSIKAIKAAQYRRLHTLVKQSQLLPYLSVQVIKDSLSSPKKSIVHITNNSKVPITRPVLQIRHYNEGGRFIATSYKPISTVIPPSETKKIELPEDNVKVSILKVNQ